MRHRTLQELEAGLDHLRASPSEAGTVELVVARPSPGERVVLELGELTPELGLVGDSWSRRRSKRTADGSPHPDMQVTLVNARLSTLLAAEGTLEHRTLVGDQLHVDLDIGRANLPAGTRVAVGSAIVEITDQPHRGCKKFAARFGVTALRFVNIGPGRELRLRGVNAKVVQAGTVAPGDVAKKL